MENKDLKPKIRFKGFTDTWEQRKLGEIIQYKNGRGHEEEQSGFGKYELINLNSISIDGGLKSSGKFVNKDSDTLIKDDLVMILSDVGHGDLLGRVAIIPENNRFILNQRVALLRIKDNTNAQFLFSFINANQQYFKVNGAGSSQLNISKSCVENFCVIISKIQEQEKIGILFEQLDNLITFYQCKYDKLVNIKKSLLEKMFPKNGENTPKIRFKGFTEDWEQRKLGEVANIVSGGTPSTIIEEYWNGNINWYSPVEIGEQIYVSSSQKKISELGYQKSSAKILPIGTVLFTSRAGIGNTAILAKEGCTNQGFQSIVPNEKVIDSYFIFSMTPKLKEFGERTGAGSTFVEVSGKQMQEMPINFPKFDEQLKISTLFKNLDNLITLHQHKLEKLQNIKKLLLDKMFV